MPWPGRSCNPTSMDVQLKMSTLAVTLSVCWGCAGEPVQCLDNSISPACIFLLTFNAVGVALRSFSSSIALPPHILESLGSIYLIRHGVE